MAMKTSNLIVPLLLLGSISACDFLDEGLKGGYSAENYYTDENKAEMAVNAIYNSLYGNTLWIFGDVASDDAVKGGNAGDQAEINSIDDFSAAADNGVLSTYWTAAYETIARANNAIANIEAMDIPSSDRLTAEALFLRSYAYFNLVNIFGSVPLKLLPQNETAHIHVGLSSVDAIYDQVEGDLADAAAALPEAYPAAEAGRVTRGAALALLAKVRLFRNDWDGCLQAIQAFEAVTETVYALEPSYADLFKAGGEDSPESIFAIRYGRSTTANMGNNLNVWFSPSVEGGYYFDAPTQDYVDCFDETTGDGATDPRLDASIGRDGRPWFNGTTFQAAWSEATGYLVKKYDEDLSTEFAKSESVIPQHILRYADLLLMKAEALNESGSGNAAAPLDEVRARAGLTATAASGREALRNAIRKERRRELGFEFHRFFDVMRYGRDYAVGALGAKAWEDGRFYFPLPQAETDANHALKD